MDEWKCFVMKCFVLKFCAEIVLNSMEQGTIYTNTYQKEISDCNYMKILLSHLDFMG